MTYPTKVSRPIGIWTWGSARLKAYALADDPDVIEPQVLQSARAVLRDAEDQPTASGETGFSIVHRCGTQHLLLACTWREENELWETVWWDGSGSFQLFGRTAHHVPTYCVWELGIVAHEGRAWRRRLDDRDSPGALDRYTEDTFAGRV